MSYNSYYNFCMVSICLIICRKSHYGAQNGLEFYDSPKVGITQYPDRIFER